MERYLCQNWVTLQIKKKGEVSFTNLETFYPF